MFRKETDELDKVKKSYEVASLSEHIYLHHVSTDLLINGERILPWEYINCKIYIADTWWETDEDIPNDLSNMSLIKFMTKYKAYKNIILGTYVVD